MQCLGVLGVMVNRLMYSGHRVTILEIVEALACLGWRAIYRNLLSGIAIRMAAPAMATVHYSGCMMRKRIPGWSCGDILRDVYQRYSHPENCGDACGLLKSPSAASKSTNWQKRIKKIWLPLTLGAAVYLPPIPLWLISKTSIRPPMLLLLATQGWITMVATSLAILAALYWWGEAWVMTLNDQAHPTGAGGQDGAERNP